MSQDPYAHYDPNRAGEVAEGGGNVRWWQLRLKDGHFRNGKEGPTIPGFEGFLKDFDIEDDAGNAEKDIPPHWKVTLTTAVHKEGAWLDYKTSVSVLGLSALSNVINVLAGVLEADRLWDKWVRLRVYQPDGASGHRLSIRVVSSEQQPAKYQWNRETNKGYIGVPEPILLGEVKGKMVFNWEPTEQFWLREAIKFYSRFHGRPYTGAALKHLPAGEAPQQMPTTNQTAPAQLSPADDFWQRSKKYLDAKTEEELLTSLNRALAHNKTAGIGIDQHEIIAKWAVALQALPGCASKAFSITKDGSCVVIETGAGGDDLPF